MPYVQLACSSCHKPVRVDTDKLPAAVALLRCPSCGEAMRVEKSKLLAEAGVSAADTPPPTPPGAAAAPSPPTSHAARKPFLPPYFEIPPDTRLPPGLVVSEDEEVSRRLQAALEPLGCRLQTLSTLSSLAEVEDMPEIVVCVIGSDTDAREALAPLRAMPNHRRRRSFVMMVGDSHPTLDGQQAFLHEVDLVLNKADLDVAAEAVFLAFEFRKRLWGPLLAAEDGLV